MTRPVMSLYKEAVKNDTFMSEFGKHEPKYRKPSMWWSNDTKVFIASIYMGWLIARNEYNESNYED